MRKIAAHYLYPLDRPPIPRGYLCLNTDNVIVETGILDDEAESTEFYNGILCPGFVNSHCHIELSHLKGKFFQGSGMAGFIRQINQLRESVVETERKSCIAKEMQALFDSGVSAIADISNCEESFKIKATSPIYTRTFLEVFGSESEDCQKIIEKVKELNKISQSYGIDAAPTPHSCYTMSTPLLSSSIKEALSAGWLSFHNQESWEEEELIRYGQGPLADEYRGRGLSTPPVTGETALFYFLEVLRSVSEEDKIKEQILLVHNTFTNLESIEKASGMIENLYWAICPMSNLFIHRALPPLELLRRKNMTITLGTDSLSSNTTLSMIEEIKTIQRYFPFISLEEILTWTCLNGARFLKKENELGSFEPGKKPGVVLIDNIDFRNMSLTEQSKSVRLA
jgi:cytosine/adenosine deaminase-related metal-dependent hydrolase